ncbi:MAG: hypothetical protein ACEQSQ_00245 [Candidatus Paceibacteria bacterium]
MGKLVKPFDSFGDKSKGKKVDEIVFVVTEDNEILVTEDGKIIITDKE